MHSQKEPDGVEGHIERDVFQEGYKAAPKKKKFTGCRIQKVAEWMSQSDSLGISKRDIKYFNHIGEIANLQLECRFYKIGCTPHNCINCKKRKRK